MKIYKTILKYKKKPDNNIEIMSGLPIKKCKSYVINNVFDIESHFYEIQLSLFQKFLINLIGLPKGIFLIKEDAK